MKPWIASSAAVVAVADALLLRWVGVPWRAQALAVLFFAAATGTGALLLHARRAAFADRFVFGLASLSLGLALHMILGFVAFHRSVWAALGFDGLRPTLQALFVLLVVLGIAGFIRCARATRLPAFTSPALATALFAIASLVAGATHFAFGNRPDLKIHSWGDDPAKGGQENTVVADFIEDYGDPTFDPGRERVPEWASRIDSLWYIWLWPAWMSSHGLPAAFGPAADNADPTLAQFHHVGVELQLCGYLAAVAPFGAESSAACSKPLALAWMFLLGAWLFVIGRDVLGLAAREAFVAAAAGYFFAALNLGAPFSDPPAATNVLGYIATPIWWNLNQVAHLAIGLAGVYLVLADLARPRGVYAAGCALLAASVYYKPSLYFVVAPALGLASLRLGRGFFRADVLLGWVVLVGASAFWFGYPRWFDLPLIESPVAFGVLANQTWYARGGVLPLAWDAHLPSYAYKLVIACAFVGAWIIPLAALLRDAARGGREQRRRIAAELARPERLMLVLLLAWGILSSWCIVQDNRFLTANNFFFGGAAAYVACLPLLVAAIGRIASRPWRTLAWLVYAGHFASGLYNLWLYAREGRLT